MKCSLEWQNQDAAVQNASILPYRARLASIRIDSHPAGFVEVHEKKSIGGLFHDIRINHGPVWLTGFGGAHHQSAFFNEFSRLMPPRFGRRRYILPGIEDGPVARKMLESAGLKKAGERYSGCRIDLKAYQPEIVKLVDALRSEWKWGISALVSETGLIRALFQHSEDLDMLSGRIFRNDTLICTVVIMRRGNQALCLKAGAAGADAGLILLREACAVLKEAGVTLFDLGGIYNDADSIGFIQKNMGGSVYTLAGPYI